MPPGKYTVHKNGMTRAEYRLAHNPLATPEAQAKAQQAKQSNASGTFRRKSQATEAERKAQSERMQADNPAKRPEVREKIRQTLLAKKDMLAERARQQHAEGRFGEHLPMSAEARQAQSQRMTEQNPMKNPETAAKVALNKRWRWLADPKGMAEAWIRAGVAPNKAEAALAEILTPLGFRFVGDGAFWIGPCQSGMCRNPDFIYKSGRQKIGLLLNGEYWHQRPERNDIQEMADYTAQGWQMLVISDKELSNPAAIMVKVKAWLVGLKSSK